MRKTKDGFGRSENKAAYKGKVLTGIDKFVIALKLLGIFLLVRLVMLDAGMSFVHIPFVDPQLVKLSALLKASLGFIERFWRQYR